MNKLKASYILWSIRWWVKYFVLLKKLGFKFNSIDTIMLETCYLLHGIYFYLVPALILYFILT